MENLTFPSSQSKLTNIVLVGFPGAGKSSIGKKLANTLNFELIDVDQYFEQKYCFTIYSFFQRFGEELFRQYERDILHELLQKEGVVIATGGGTPCFFDNMERINAAALSVYIKLSNESLFVRLRQSKQRRPLCKNLTEEELRQYVETEMQRRAPFYEQAKITVKGENFDKDALVREISYLCNQFL